MAFVVSKFASRTDRLEEIAGFVRTCAERHGLEAKRITGLLIAVEEAFVNVCHYAYPDGEGEVEVTCGDADDAFIVQIADEGVPFDILSIPEPDLNADLMDRPIGGLGVHFIRKLTDEVSYRRENGRNILRLALRSKNDSENAPQS